MTSPMEIGLEQNQPNTRGGLARLAAVSALVAGGIAGVAAVNGGESDASQAVGAGVEDCIDGTGPDYGPVDVNSSFLVIPGQENAYLERVCIQYTDGEYVERVFEGTDVNGYQENGRPIDSASADYEFLPVVTTTTEATTTTTEAPVEKVCDPLDSGKIDVQGDVKVITITAQPGELISRYCVKAGSANQGLGPEYVDVEPPVMSVEIEHTSGKDISHYSFATEEKPEVTTTTAPEVTTTTAPEVTTTTAPEVTTTTAPEVTTTTAPEVTTTTAPEVTTTTAPEVTTTTAPSTPTVPVPPTE